MKLFERFLNLIFPPKCIFCGSILEVTSTLNICSICYKKIPFIDNSNDTFIKSNNSTGCDNITCVCRYSGIIKDSLIRYKFYNKPGYYRTFARLLSLQISRTIDYNKYDMIISIPLHHKKELSRGYNQALLISKALSRELKIPECSGVLKRIKYTDAQSLLKKGDRSINVKGAFRVINSDMIKDKSILLVDDILTTGSTANECSKVLKEAGARIVDAAVIASGKK